MPEMMACKTAPMPLTMAIWHDPMAPRTASIWKTRIPPSANSSFTVAFPAKKRKEGRKRWATYARDDGTHDVGRVDGLFVVFLVQVDVVDGRDGSVGG
jgi:hypothetical protein